jgi:Bacterial PH domain
MSRRLVTGEHDGEPQRGLPERLPASERLLWQGEPDWRLLARHGFHIRKFALYFGVLLAWRGITAWYDGGTVGAVLGSMIWPVPLAALALGFIAMLAWLVGRTTVYTLTDRRVVMRIGIVLTVTFNLPMSRIETVRMHALGGQGAGEIALVLDPKDRIGYMHLWPHARPWHFRRTEPMLRALPQADHVARLLVDALAATVAEAPQAVAEPRGRRQPDTASQGGRQPMPHAA